MNTKQSETSTPSLWRRLASTFYDTFLVFGISCILAGLALILKIQFGAPIDKTDVALNTHEQIILQLFILLSIYLFFTHFWLSAGKTLGMQTWSMRIVSDTNRPMTRVQVSVRFFVAIISYGFFGLGMIWCLFDKEKRSWQDIASKTSLKLES